jgi:hypothetical protein
MNDVERNRPSEVEEHRAPPEDDQRSGSGNPVTWWAVAAMSFIAGVAVITILLAVAFVDVLAGPLVSASVAIVIGTAVGMLIGAVAGWYASRHYYRTWAA